jgi:hypothetical protein
MPDPAREAFLRKMMAEGTSDDDIIATLKVYDAQHPATTAPAAGRGSGYDPNAHGALANFLEEALSSVNPSKINDAVQQSFWHPIDTIKGIGQAQGALAQKTAEAYQRGDYPTMVRHAVSYLIPILGPRLDQASDYMQQGQIARGLGATTDVALQTVLPEAAARLPALRVPALVGATREPGMARAIETGRAMGVPMDAATATGNTFVQGVQKLADESLLGSLVGSRAKAAQRAGVQDMGRALQAEAHPVPVEAGAAGQTAQEALGGVVARERGTANAAYTRLRAIEADPANASTFQPTSSVNPVSVAPWNKAETGKPITVTAWRGTPNGGGKLTAATRSELGRDALLGEGEYHGGTQWVASKFSDNPAASNVTLENPYVIKVQGQSQLKKVSNEQIAAIRESGHDGIIVKHAGNNGDESALQLVVFPKTAQTVPMAVDFTETKAAVQPIADRLAAKKAITGALVGAEATAADVINSIISGPDVAPLSVADGVLSDLKRMARSNNPNLRTAGQGIAAKAVDNLHRAVSEAAERAGPEAVQALDTGRTATKAKYAAAKILKQLVGREGIKEPVAAFRTIIKPGDASLGTLRDVLTQAPDTKPEIARAVLDGIIDHPTMGVDAKASAWGRLGANTKALLYTPEHIQALDDFFLLAQKIAENPNRSGSGTLVAKLLELGAASKLSPLAPAVSALLHSEAGVRLLTKGFRIPLASKAAQAAWFASVTRAIGQQQEEQP